MTKYGNRLQQSDFPGNVCSRKPQVACLRGLVTEVPCSSQPTRRVFSASCCPLWTGLQRLAVPFLASLKSIPFPLGVPLVPPVLKPERAGPRALAPCSASPFPMRRWRSPPDIPGFPDESKRQPLAGCTPQPRKAHGPHSTPGCGQYIGVSLGHCWLRDSPASPVAESRPLLILVRQPSRDAGFALWKLTRPGAGSEVRQTCTQPLTPPGTRFLGSSSVGCRIHGVPTVSGWGAPTDAIMEAMTCSTLASERQGYSC